MASRYRKAEEDAANQPRSLLRRPVLARLRVLPPPVFNAPGQESDDGEKELALLVGVMSRDKSFFQSISLIFVISFVVFVLIFVLLR